MHFQFWSRISPTLDCVFNCALIFLVLTSVTNIPPFWCCLSLVPLVPHLEVSLRFLSFVSSVVCPFQFTVLSRLKQSILCSCQNQLKSDEVTPPSLYFSLLYLVVFSSSLSFYPFSLPLAQYYRPRSFFWALPVVCVLWVLCCSSKQK